MNASSSIQRFFCMRRTTLPLLLVACIIARPRVMHAQSSGAASGFVVESWTVRDGLPVNGIFDLHQSQSGYIWLATYDGLVRFDGVRFTLYNTGNSEGLPSNRIVRISETSDSSLWLLTDLFKLVRLRDGRFTHIDAAHGLDSDVLTTFEDAGHTIWVGTQNGIGRIINDRFVPVAAGTITEPVHAIAQRKDGSIYVGAARGLLRIDGDAAAPVAGAAQLPSDPVIALYVDKSDALWIGSRTGVWRYTGSLQQTALRPAGSAPLTFRTSSRGALLVRARDGVYRLDERGVARMFDVPTPAFGPWFADHDPDGRLWYSDGNAIYSHSRRAYVTSRDASLNDGLTSMVVDHEGSVWFGSASGGLRRLKPAVFTNIGMREGLFADNISTVGVDHTGAVWIPSGARFSRIANGRVTVHDLPSEGTTATGSFLDDRNGMIRLGATACSMPALQCTTAPDAPKGTVFALTEDADGAIWMGASSGLFRYDGSKWTQLTTRVGAPSAVVRAFARTDDGALWMGTNGSGIARYHDGAFTKITIADGLPNDLVRSLYVDGNGWLWVGTEGSGLARVDPRNWSLPFRRDRIVPIRTRDGLFDDVVHAIVPDDFDRLWMSSNRGISWVSRAELNAFADGKARRVHATGYTERHGLRNREANGGGQPAGARTPDGRIWFPTQSGVAIVDPAHVGRTRLAARVQIEDVIAGGEPLDPSRVLEIPGGSRDLQIRYTALSFLAAENIRFRYRLEPYDRDWVDADTRRTAFYTKVPPGRYTFRVMASTGDDVWDPNGAAFELHVAPRFFETWWFRALMLVAVAVLVWGLIRWRVSRLRFLAMQLQQRVDQRTSELREREALLAAQNVQLADQTDQLKELDRAKTNFFANVSHELRTPLTLTIGPLEDVRSQLLSDTAAGNDTHVEAVPRIDMALRNSRRLFQLVNQLLDVAKLEAGRMPLRSRRGDLITFVRGVAAAFTASAERRGMLFEIRAAPGAVDASFDPDALEKVLTNLLSNAFKFTPDGGSILLEVECVANHGTHAFARIRVTDSGPGVPAAHLPHVFDRFYQVDASNARSQPGTGIGLSLARELAELHGGTLNVQSEGGRGAVFMLTLPLGDEITEVMTPAVALPEDVTTLLVVDDNADMRRYVRDRFATRFRVVEAADGNEGIAHARE
ncbi:MAG: two-component regulator propeller domain-containing protein, partial [Longimicrobiales bacterium]